MGWKDQHLVLAAANQAGKPKLQYKVKIPIFQPRTCQERENRFKSLGRKSAAAGGKQGGCSRHGGLRTPGQVRIPTLPISRSLFSRVAAPPPPHPTHAAAPTPSTRHPQWNPPSGGRQREAGGESTILPKLPS